MGAFQRDQRRALATGVCLNAPKDLVPAGKWPVLQNVRSYQAGTLYARLGLGIITGGGIGAGLIHSIARLNDSTPWATAPFWRIFGAGAAIRAGQSSYPQIDTGYSGNPLTFMAAAPVQAANPYIYVGDSVRQQKFDVNGHVFPMGIVPPALEPSAVVGPLPGNFIDSAGGVGNWVPAGAAAGPITAIQRVNTTIAGIIYDSGTSGNASVIPTVMTGINSDCVLNFGGVESLVVLQVCLPIVSTTIAAIIYDSGVSGFCTIQPAASLGTGQIQAPDFNDYAVRYGGYGSTALLNRDDTNWLGFGSKSSTTAQQLGGTPAVPASKSAGRIRQVDFPVNCLVGINGVETVRILSVSLGPDGIQSFRCFVTGTYSAGQTLVGAASFRVNSGGTYAAGATLQANALENSITPSGTPPGATGGIMTKPPWVPVNNPAVQWNGTATLPEDDFHISVRIDDCTVVTAIRVYLDVDAAVNDFTQNYYFFEWRSNDIIAAIQATNVATTATLQQTRATVVGNSQLNAHDQFLADAKAADDAVVARGGNYGDRLLAQLTLGNGKVGPNSQASGTSQALAIGNNQWLELHCKIGSFIHVGTDPSRSLQNVKLIEVIVQMAGALPIKIDYGAIYLSGGNNADCGYTGAPRSYAYRYRSSITGARSNPSPSVRGGVIPRRQFVTLTGVQSADPQVDLVDWFTIEGPTGNLDRFTYMGTGQNSSPPTFIDNYSDSRLVGGPVLEYNVFQPWATVDRNRSSVVNVAGSAVRRTGGVDPFNINWAPGSIIIINGQPYTLRARPQSTTFLEINENAGALTGATAILPAPTLLGQPLRSIWGPDVDNVFYGCGDPSNPGVLYWTFPNDPDRTSDANAVQVTSGSERLQAGFVYDDRPYAFSTDNLYAIIPSSNQTGRLGIVTPCGKGVWTPWFWCMAPEGIYFGTKDGIYLTVGGSVAISITDNDLYSLFPHDGTVGIAVNGFLPPDYGVPNRLRLAYVDGYVYFDYVDTGGASRSLAFRTSDVSWWPDLYTPGVASRLSTGGALVYEELIGGVDGTVYQPAGFLDNATQIACQAQFVNNQGDARIQKIYRDVMVEAILGGANVSVNLTTSNDLVNLGTTVITGGSGRLAYDVGIIPTLGAYGTNIAVLLTWNPVGVAVPQLFLTDIGYQNEVESAISWLSGPTTFNLSGYMHVLGAYICYLASTPVNLSVIIDGVTYNYTLPTTGGLYAKSFVWLKAVKGLTYQLGMQATASFMVFDKDIEFFVQAWGKTGGYRLIRPF